MPKTHLSDTNLLQEHHLRLCACMNWQPEASLQCVLCEDLSFEYPLVIYQWENQRVLALCPDMEEAAEDLLSLPHTAPFADYIDALFEGVTFSPDDALYLCCDNAHLKDADSSVCIPLGAEHEDAVQALLSSLAPEEAARAMLSAQDDIAFGLFQDGKLCAAASAQIENGLADIAVVVHPACRQSGLGKAVVRAVCRQAFSLQLIAQYRAELANMPSTALAQSLGFVPSVQQWGCVVHFPDEEE